MLRERRADWRLCFVRGRSAGIQPLRKSPFTFTSARLQLVACRPACVAQWVGIFTELSTMPPSSVYLSISDPHLPSTSFVTLLPTYPIWGDPSGALYNQLWFSIMNNSWSSENLTTTLFTTPIIYEQVKWHWSQYLTAELSVCSFLGFLLLKLLLIHKIHLCSDLSLLRRLWCSILVKSLLLIQCLSSHLFACLWLQFLQICLKQISGKGVPVIFLVLLWAPFKKLSPVSSLQCVGWF